MDILITIVLFIIFFINFIYFCVRCGKRYKQGINNENRNSQIFTVPVQNIQNTGVSTEELIYNQSTSTNNVENIEIINDEASTFQKYKTIALLGTSTNGNLNTSRNFITPTRLHIETINSRDESEYVNNNISVNRNSDVSPGFINDLQSRVNNPITTEEYLRQPSYNPNFIPIPDAYV